MLPNRMVLKKETEEQLKQLKAKTGITPNVSARIAFFRSIESEFRYQPEADYNTNGNLALDKVTWLGRTQQATELLLKHNYPELEGKQLQQAWAAHVEHGVASLRNLRSLTNLTKKLSSI